MYIFFGHLQMGEYTLNSLLSSVANKLRSNTRQPIVTGIGESWCESTSQLSLSVFGDPSEVCTLFIRSVIIVLCCWSNDLPLELQIWTRWRYVLLSCYSFLGAIRSTDRFYCRDFNVYIPQIFVHVHRWHWIRNFLIVKFQIQSISLVAN